MNTLSPITRDDCPVQDDPDLIEPGPDDPTEADRDWWASETEGWHDLDGPDDPGIDAHPLIEDDPDFQAAEAAYWARLHAAEEYADWIARQAEAEAEPDWDDLSDESEALRRYEGGFLL